MTDHPRSPDSAKEPDWEALARLMAKESSPEETAELRRMLRENAARANLVGLLSEIGRAPEPVAPTAGETEMALRAVLGRRDDVSIKAPVVSLGAYRARRVSSRWLAAAAVIIIAGGALLVRSRGNIETSAGPNAYATGVGEVKGIALLDGTRINLGPASRLRVEEGGRVVTLDGEARFEVVHNAARPFVVRTASGSFRDVGTVFAVQTNAKEGSRVAVSEGAVAIESQGTARVATLKAGDRALVATGGAVSVERGTVTAGDFAWTTGELVFHDATVAQVAAEVRRWRGVDLEVDSSLSARRITATFTPSDDRMTIARTVASVLGGGIHDEGSTLRIVPAPTVPARR
jgi:transmembrane sensor